MAFSNHHTVSNKYTLELQGLAVNNLVNVSENFIGKLGDIHTTVRFSRDPEVISCKFWEFLEPLGNGSQIVLGSTCVTIVVGWVLVDGKSDTWWTLQKEHVSVIIPGEGVFRRRQFVSALIQDVWSVLLQESYINEFVPSKLEHPGPPLSQRTTSSVSGAFFEVTKM